jgi:hypothetical protein
MTDVEGGDTRARKQNNQRVFAAAGGRRKGECARLPCKAEGGVHHLSVARRAGVNHANVASEG